MESRWTGRGLRHEASQGGEEVGYDELSDGSTYGLTRGVVELIVDSAIDSAQSCFSSCLIEVGVTACLRLTAVKRPFTESGVVVGRAGEGDVGSKNSVEHGCGRRAERTVARGVAREIRRAN